MEKPVAFYSRKLLPREQVPRTAMRVDYLGKLETLPILQPYHDGLRPFEEGRGGGGGVMPDPQHLNICFMQIPLSLITFACTIKTADSSP